MATAQKDDSGFIEIKDNKLSKPGVFDYKGSDIGAPMPDAVYKVYRPKSELSCKECVESFKLLPWIISHKMLGKKYNSPAEEKGVHGTTGENIYFDESDNYLKGNIKIFSDELESEIDSGIDELSLGFKCLYDFTPGRNEDGVYYDVIQHEIRGNHLASVEKSRMKVSVMDEDNVTYGMDAMNFSIKEENAMSGKKKSSNQKYVGMDSENITQDQMKSVICDIAPLLGPLASMIKSHAMDEEMAKKKAEDEEEEKKKAEDEEKKKAEDEEKKKAEDEEKKDDKSSGMDAQSVLNALEKMVAPLSKKIDALEEQSKGMDSETVTKKMLADIDSRNKLANQLRPVIGTFDHDSMTLDQVKNYGVEKLNLDKSHDAGSVLAGYFAARDAIPTTDLYTPTGQDGDNSSSLVDAHINGS